MLYLTSGSREENLGFELKVSSVLSNLHSKLPRTFWGFIISKTLFFTLVWNLSENLRALSKFSNKILKNAFYVSRGTLWRKHYVDSVKQFPTLGEKMFELQRKICSTVLKSALFVSRWAIGRIVLKEILLFLIFFGRPGNIFWFFLLNHSRNCRQNSFFQTKQNISIKKNILTKHFFHFRTRRDIFLNFQWNI